MSQRLLAVVAALAALPLAAPGSSATTVGGVPARAAPATASVTAAGSAARQSLDLIAAVAESVDLQQHVIVLSGHALTWDPAHLKVFAGGVPTTPDRLRPGQPVHYALEPGDGPHRKVVLIRVDAPR